MNVLFLTIAWPENNESNIYTDLMEEFRDEGHSVYVAALREKRSGKTTGHVLQNNINLLWVLCGNIVKTNPVKKGINSFLLGYKMKAAIKKYYQKVKFDLIIYSTPPITLAGLVKKLKKSHNAKTYLLLKDIWPQAPADLGAIREGGPMWRYFRKKEKQIYNVSDYIGCMSPANVEFVLKHNAEVIEEKVEECPNSIRPGKNKRTVSDTIRQQYGISDDAVLFLFGGNIGRPQGVSFLVDAAARLDGRKDIFFLIVGWGTESLKIQREIKNKNLNNILLVDSLPKHDYEAICASCDVGLVLLDRRFSVPNFPSRLLSYLDAGIPVLCATNDFCDMGDILEDWDCGIKVLHGDTDCFINQVERLAGDKELRRKMGYNARRLLEEKYTSKQSYEVIIKHFSNFL